MQMSMTRTPYIENIGLHLDGVPDEERLDLWADLVRPLFDVSPLSTGAEPPVTCADAWLLDNLVLTRVAFGSQIFDRNSKHLNADIADCLLLQIYVSGEQQVEVDGDSVPVRAGDLHIQDFSRPFRSRATSARVLGLLVSHERVGYDKGRHPAVMHLPRDSAANCVVKSSILSVFRRLEKTTKAEQTMIAGGLVGLLRGALFSPTSAAAPSEGFAAARSRAIRQYIAQNLRSDRLTADAVCTRFGLSRTSLYRDFQADGGFERHIMARRLDAALMDLALTDSPRGAVGRAAEAWGFSSSSHFIREFRRKFGFSPSSAVGARPGSEAAFPDGERFQGRPGVPDLLPLLKKL